MMMGRSPPGQRVTARAGWPIFATPIWQVERTRVHRSPAGVVAAHRRYGRRPHAHQRASTGAL